MYKNKSQGPFAFTINTKTNKEIANNLCLGANSLLPIKIYLIEKK